MASAVHITSRPLVSTEPITVTKTPLGTDWHAQVSSLRNQRTDTKNPKPNEDRAEIDPVRQTVVVADGITRTKATDDRYPDPSPSAEAAALFCQTVKALAAQTPEMDLTKLKGIVSTANEAVAQFNRRYFMNYDFAERDRAGLAAVIGIIEGDTLWLASIADCWCVGVNDEGIHRHAWEKTSHSRAEYVRLGEIPAREALRNKPGYHLSYGAITGEAEALPFVEYAQIDLTTTTRLVFATDGLLRVAQENASAVAKLPAEHLVRYGSVLDRIYGETDDKTIVVLDRRNRDQ